MTDKCQFHFKTAKAGSKKIKDGTTPSDPTPPPERIPRISRLMALAIHFDLLIRRGVVRDYADLARLGSITRARVTQIMNLLNLAPDIQERLLFLPGTQFGRDSVSERDLRPEARKLDWKTQSVPMQGPRLL
jgi:hypothetical protein